MDSQYFLFWLAQKNRVAFSGAQVSYARVEERNKREDFPAQLPRRIFIRRSNEINIP